MVAAAGDDEAEAVQSAGGQHDLLLRLGELERAVRLEFRDRQVALLGVNVREREERACTGGGRVGGGP